MKEIRYEITNQVKADMKEELDQLKIEFNKGTEERDKNADLEGLEPKVKEAMLRMRKLDRILKKRVKREKEVKRDRILLQKRSGFGFEIMFTVNSRKFRPPYKFGSL